MSTVIVGTLFDKNTPYSLAADELLNRLPLARKLSRKAGSHWLCRMLDSTTEALSPGTYTDALRKDVRAGLQAAGMASFAAAAIGEVAGQLADKAAAIAFGPTSIGDTLRVINLLVCPDITSCPAQKNVRKSLMKPAVEQSIEDLAT